MPQRKTLNERQIDVLRWIGAGCPAGPMVTEDHPERITAGALRNRGLVTTKGRGASWTATITKGGLDYLDAVDGPSPPIPRSSNTPATQQLVDKVVAAGGSLVVADNCYRGPGHVDYRRRVERAMRAGRVPPGKDLTVTVLRERYATTGLRIDLVDAPAGTPHAAGEIAVPTRVGRFHKAVTELRDDRDRLEVSRAQLPRGLVLLHALVTEAESRGHAVRGPARLAGRQDGGPVWAGDRDGHLTFAVFDVDVQLRVHEDGVSTRRIHEYVWRRRADSAAPRRRDYTHEQGAKGTLRFTIVRPRLGNGRPTSWGDGKTRRLDELLGEVLAGIETVAAAERERQVQARLEEQRRRDAWQAALEDARGRYLEHHKAVELDAQIAAWTRAVRIRDYCRTARSAGAIDAGTEEWLTWAETFADGIDPLLRSPKPPPAPADIGPGDLQPFLGGWNAYGPDLVRPYPAPLI